MQRPPATPASVTTAAVLLFVYSGLLLFCGICGAAGSAFSMAAKGQGGDQARMQAMLDKEAPGNQIVGYANLAMNFLVAFMMLGAGIGVLKWSGIARLLAFLAIAIELLITIAVNIYQIVFVIPVTKKLFADAMAQQQAKGGPPAPFDIGAMMTGAGLVVVVITILIKLGLLLPILICLNTAKARAAFAGTLQGPPDDGDDPNRRSRSSGYDDDDGGYGSPRPPKSPGDTGITR